MKLEVEAVHEVSLLVKISLLDLLKDLKHTSYHFVDTHIIIAYTKNEVPLLTKYIEHSSLSGCHFFCHQKDCFRI